MKKINWICTILLTMVMVGFSELLGEKEIIFPEIAALTIGAWLVPKQPWKVSRMKLFFLMSLSSVMGLILSRYIPLPIYLKVSIAFSFTALALTFSKTTLFPMISACVLPILLGTTSWIYPISVTVLSALIVCIQYLLEKGHYRKSFPMQSCNFELQTETAVWCKRLFYLMLLMIIPCFIRQYFFIAPPLIVAFVELSQLQSPARRCPHKVIGLTVASACIGTFLSLAHLYTPLPLTLCAGFAMVGVLLCMQQLSLFLPPAGAIAILPMIIAPEKLIYYPIEVTIGISLLTLCALTRFTSLTVASRS